MKWIKLMKESGRRKFKTTLVKGGGNSFCEAVRNMGNKFNPGDVVRKFNIGGSTPLNLNDAKEIFSKRKGGPASMPVKSNRAFSLNEMYEVESEKATTFSSRERWIPILGKDD